MRKQGAQYTIMTDEVRIALCKHKQDHPELSQDDLLRWLQDAHNIKVSQSTISKTLKRTVELLDRRDDVNLSAKRQKTVHFPDMESALAEWFYAHHGRINITGDLMKEKGTFFLNELHPGHPLFKFSNGWLEKFKARHGIKSFHRFGESGSVNMAVIEDAVSSLRQTLDQYEWKDIYNMDETGLFYRMQADHSLATKQLEGRKKSKERITLAVCANGDGSDKLPLLVIGKYENPHCFKNINLANLGCKYLHSKKALMTQTIFVEWLKGFDLHVTGRKVLLILDNCSAHIPLSLIENVVTLHNTTVVYLPPNTTSKIHPCDVGIMRNLKAYYRRRFNRLLLQRIEDNVQDPEKIDILEAIRIVVAAWTMDVKPLLIQNCFIHCGIKTPELGATHIHEDNLIDHKVIEELESQIRQFRYTDPIDIQNLLTYLAEEEVAAIPTEEEIVGRFLQPSQAETVDDQDAEEDDDTEEVLPIPAAQALQLAHSLEHFWLQQPNVNPRFLVTLQEMKDSISVTKT